MIYSAIDIGSDTIKIVVAKIVDNAISILAAVNTRSVGVKKGLIVDKDLVIESLNLALDELEKKLGFRIDKAIVSVPFYHVDVNIYNGLSYPSGEITGSDIITCFKSCVSTVDIDLEVVSVFPIHFYVDGEMVDDPKGMTGEKLESKILISTVPKQGLYSFLEVFEKCKIDVIDLSFGPINDFYNVKDNRDYTKLYGALVDIGKDKTEIAIFNKGLMVCGDTFPFGSRLVDNDINYMYQLDKSTIRDIKENFAYSSSKYANPLENLEYDTENGKLVINQEGISQIAEARVEEILKNVKKAINDLTNREISYIIITGGITNSLGFDYLMGEVFKDNACVINMNLVGVRDNIYASCVGMIKYYYDKLKLREIEYTMYDDIVNMTSGKKSVLQEAIIDDMRRYLENN